LFYFVELFYKETTSSTIRNSQYIRYKAWPYDQNLYNILKNAEGNIFYDTNVNENFDGSVYEEFFLIGNGMDNYTYINDNELYLIDDIIK